MSVSLDKQGGRESKSSSDPRACSPLNVVAADDPSANRATAPWREALELWESPDVPDLVPQFAALADTLRSNFPERWLLRWNLLECLAKTKRRGALADTLRSELLAIERERPDDLPISMGLRYLDEQHLD